MAVEEAARRVRAALGLPLGQRGEPASGLVVLCGLPGSGKSFLAAAVAARREVAIVRADAVRKALYPRPTYTPAESGFVYQVCYALLRLLLAGGHQALFDATNLTRSGRRTLGTLAQAAAAPCLVVWVDAPEEVIRQRLRSRSQEPGTAFQSDATWEVYVRMRETVERPRSPDLVADTDAALPAAVDAIGQFLAAVALVPSPATGGLDAETE